MIYLTYLYTRPYKSGVCFSTYYFGAVTFQVISSLTGGRGSCVSTVLESQEAFLDGDHIWKGL